MTHDSVLIAAAWHRLLGSDAGGRFAEELDRFRGKPPLVAGSAVRGLDRKLRRCLGQLGCKPRPATGPVMMYALAQNLNTLGRNLPPALCGPIGRAFHEALESVGADPWLEMALACELEWLPGSRSEDPWFEIQHLLRASLWDSPWERVGSVLWEFPWLKKLGERIQEGFESVLCARAIWMASDHPEAPRRVAATEELITQVYLKRNFPAGSLRLEDGSEALVVVH